MSRAEWTIAWRHARAERDEAHYAGCHAMTRAFLLARATLRERGA